VDVLDCDLLLALTAMTIESIEQHSVGAGELVGLVQGLTMAIKEWCDALWRAAAASVELHADRFDERRPPHNVLFDQMLEFLGA
jgi:hypothetical protein